MAMPVFPDQNLSSFIEDFIKELEEDFQSPTISKFQDYMPKCRAGLQAMEEVSTNWKLCYCMGKKHGIFSVAVAASCIL